MSKSNTIIKQALTEMVKSLHKTSLSSKSVEDTQAVNVEMAKIIDTLLLTVSRLMVYRIVNISKYTEVDEQFVENVSDLAHNALELYFSISKREFDEAFGEVKAKALRKEITKTLLEDGFNSNDTDEIPQA